MLVCYTHAFFSAIFQQVNHVDDPRLEVAGGRIKVFCSVLLTSGVWYGRLLSVALVNIKYMFVLPSDLRNSSAKAVNNPL